MQLSDILITTLLLVPAAFLIHAICIPLARNISAAKATGLRYVVVPYYQYHFITARFTRLTLLRIINSLCPIASTISWRRLVTALWPLQLRHTPFQNLGTDTFLTVSPGGIIFNTADAAVATRILSRGADFPKPIEIYRSVDIYGKNVVSSDGDTWRYHRKLTTPAFSEKNNRLVWSETLIRSQQLLASVLDVDGVSTTIDDLATKTTRLSLEVFATAGLGEKLEWPTDTTGSSGAKFTSALEYVTRNIVTITALISLFPKWVLRYSPFASARRCLSEYESVQKHMTDMIGNRRLARKAGARDFSATDLIGQLIKAQDSMDGAVLNLTDSEVLGNLFVFMVAGHETSASTLQFALILLALNPKAQKKVQQELSAIFQGRPTSEWSYDQDIPLLLKSYLGAVLNETLRLISPVLTIPKIARQTQTLEVDGTQVVIPAKTLVRLCIPALHRNPKSWASTLSTESGEIERSPNNQNHEIEDFVPERWSKESQSCAFSPKEVCSDKQISPQILVSEASSYSCKAQKGAYLPFSAGDRVCLGRRFAQVEILTALAVILSQNSIELAVDKWANDKEVAAMTLEEKEVLWRKAHDRGKAILENEMTCILTVRLIKGKSVPVRFAKYGHERFCTI